MRSAIPHVYLAIEVGVLIELKSSCKGTSMCLLLASKTVLGGRTTSSATRSSNSSISPTSCSQILTVPMSSPPPPSFASSTRRWLLTRRVTLQSKSTFLLELCYALAALSLRTSLVSKKDSIRSMCRSLISEKRMRLLFLFTLNCKQPCSSFKSFLCQLEHNAFIGLLQSGAG